MALMPSLERALGKAHGLLSGMGSSMGGAISTAVGIGIAQLAAGAVQLAGGAISGAIGQASTFEQTLAMLGAVTGATKTQLGQLSDKAIQLGADTTLPGTSAVQAAQGMMELAKAGLSVDASIAAARGTIQLARAANVSEAEAATIAANALERIRAAGKPGRHGIGSAGGQCQCQQRIHTGYGIRAANVQRGGVHRWRINSGYRNGHFAAIQCRPAGIRRRHQPKNDADQPAVAIQRRGRSAKRSGRESLRQLERPHE